MSYKCSGFSLVKGSEGYEATLVVGLPACTLGEATALLPDIIARIDTAGDSDTTEEPKEKARPARPRKKPKVEAEPDEVMPDEVMPDEVMPDEVEEVEEVEEVMPEEKPRGAGRPRKQRGRKPKAVEEVEEVEEDDFEAVLSEGLEDDDTRIQIQAMSKWKPVATVLVAAGAKTEAALKAMCMTYQDTPVIRAIIDAGALDAQVKTAITHLVK